MSDKSNYPTIVWTKEWFSGAGFKVKIEFTRVGKGYWSGPICTLWYKEDLKDWKRVEYNVGCLSEAPGILDDIAKVITTALSELNSDRPDMTYPQ